MVVMEIKLVWKVTYKFFFFFFFFFFFLIRPVRITFFVAFLNKLLLNDCVLNLEGSKLNIS